jgi:hypothetical protein
MDVREIRVWSEFSLLRLGSSSGEFLDWLHGCEILKNDFALWGYLRSV